VERNRILAETYGKDPDFFAFYRSMQTNETGLKGGDTRMVGFLPPGNARRACAVCSPLAHDPHKSDHTRCAQLWDQS
jgi:hypothetical protein